MEQKLLSKLQAQCSRREYCSRDIYDKALKALEGDAAGAQEILGSLIKDGFVDDLRYASAFARDKASLQGWGPIKITHMLRAKGIPSDTIRQALAEIDAPKAEEKLRRLIEAKRKTLEGDPAARLKLIRFALSRGYDYDAIRPLLDD